MKEWGVCTVVTASHIPAARVLASRLREHVPGTILHVLIADTLEHLPDLQREPFRAIHLEELGEPDAVREMTFIYTPFELCCALRGLLHRFLLERTELDRWLFLDSDIGIEGDITPVFEQLGEAAITLTAHIRTPAYPDHRPEPETEFLSSGIYNGGILGVRRGATAEAFARWFHDRLRRHALAAPPTFVDQLWLNLVPLLFDQVQVLDHPGVNIGHWNLHERSLRESEDGRVWVGDTAALLVHFSAADPDAPERVSRHAPWLDGRAPKAWRKLLGRYREALDAHGGSEPAPPYGFGRYADGAEIPLRDRRHYRRRLLEGTAPAGNPFEMRTLRRVALALG